MSQVYNNDMFWDFIDKYRKARAPERAQRDKKYDEERAAAANSGGTGIGSIYPKIGGIAAANVKQGLDKAGRGVSDFVSAYRDSINGGHGKIAPKNNDFFKMDSKNYADAKSIDDVDYSREFAVYRRSDKNRGASDSIDNIRVGFKNGKIATVLAYRNNPDTGEEEEYEVYGRDNLANYFRKFYEYDREYAAKPLDGNNSRTSWASGYGDRYYKTNRFAASELFRPRG